MTTFSRIPKILLVGLLSVGSAVALAACGDNTATTTTTDTPTATAPDATTPDTGTTGTVPGTGTDTATQTGGEENVVEVAADETNLSTFAQAVDAAGLTQTLSTEGPYTVFAPSDEAFAALPEGTVDELLKPENREILTQILSYHVVPEQLESSAITTGSVDTVEGAPLNVAVDQGTKEVTVNSAKVVRPDLQANNGVIHVIDQVILPPDMQESLESQEPQEPAN